MMRYRWQIRLKHRVLRVSRRLRGKPSLPDILNEALADDMVKVIKLEHKKDERYKFSNH
jgi:hypothetical protein